MPFVQYYYLGDNRRAPYGNLGRDTLMRYAREAMDSFLNLGVDACVLACNTVTAVCAGTLRREYSFPIVGCEPAVALAAKSCKKALVLATVRTAESDRLKRLVSAHPNCEFTLEGLPDLAHAIERLFLFGEPLDLSLHLPKGDYDGVVLGCTHYSLIRKEISTFYHVPVYDGAKGVASRLQSVLKGLKDEKIGTADHRISTPNLENISIEMTENNIYFLNSDNFFNKSVFLRTFVSKN